MKHTILFLFIGLCIASCHETDYPTFDDSVIDIYFTQDSVNYSFGVTPLSTTEHVVELPVRIIGASVKEVARNFKIEVVDKRTNAESPLHYTVPEQLTLEKDSVNAVVPVTLKRSALGDTEWTVAFRLLPNDYFNPTAQTEKEISCEAIITFNNVVSKPNWTTWNGSFGWSESNMGPWNPVVYVTFHGFFSTGWKRRCRQPIERWWKDTERIWIKNTIPVGENRISEVGTGILTMLFRNTYAALCMNTFRHIRNWV